MNFRYIDAHCHVQFDQYAGDQAEVIERMRREEVGGIIVGVDRASSEKAIALAEGQEHLFASVGLHPNRAAEESFSENVYRELAQNHKVVAIGECGLDYFRPEEVTDKVKQIQKELFQKHIALAAELGKPLIIHARPSRGTMDAYHELIDILKKAKTTHPRLRGDIHFFVGGTAEAEALTALGFTLSFTAVITFARDYDDVIRTIPLNMVLSETDAPYVSPEGRRGSRNDPFAAVDVVARIADIRNEDPELVRQTLVNNAKRIFAL